MQKIKDFLVPINSVCNQQCIFCSAEYRMKTNPAIPLKTIFSQVLEKDNYIQISWWEPLLDKNLFKILAFIRKVKPNIFIELQTNWIFLKKKLDKLQKYNINLYNVNYPSHIEEINDIITWVKWSLKLREEWMKEIIKRWLNLRINIIIVRQNYKYLPQMIDYIKNNFGDFERIQFSFVKVMGGADKNGKDVVPSYEEASSYIIKALQKASEYNFKIDVDHIPLCFLWDYWKYHVDYRKKVNWEKGVYLIEKTYISKCQRCKLKQYCSGYRKDYLSLYPEK